MKDFLLTSPRLGSDRLSSTRTLKPCRAVMHHDWKWHSIQLVKLVSSHTLKTKLQAWFP